MTVPVTTQSGTYDVVIERGALAHADRYFALHRRVLVVTDDGVPSAYADAVCACCASAKRLVIPQGEHSKNMEQYARILRALVDYGFTRTDCVVAVGGGVVGDMAGFAAATFMRGIDFYNVPTTVLSQVDSSVGGKTAIDFEGYKNIVGAFYPPKGVLIDPDTLATLPPRQVANGLAEALKMGLTHDEALVELFERENAADQIDTIIERAIRIKRSVVEQDEKEAGLRKVLNFGHTIGHAIESLTPSLYHGECVALGMLPLCSAEVRERILPILARLGLPTSVSVDPEALIDCMRHDKKTAGDTITVVTVPHTGTFELKEYTFSEFAEQVKAVYTR